MTEAATPADRPKLLVLTVGGSPEPLKTALAKAKPDEALFIVSAGTETVRSSAPQVDELKGLPDFPENYNILKVPADDLDRAFALIETQLAMALEAGKQVVADYTGGTKTMSAALAMAARLLGEVALQVTSGDRRDLVKVADGTETPMALADHLFSLRQQLRMAEALTDTRSYGAALAVLLRDGNMAESLPDAWRRRLVLARAWLDLLDRWDRFDHAGAIQLARGNGRLGNALKDAGLDQRLNLIAEAKGQPSAALCEDLWWNAQRRAAQGAYDDAVARLYRLAEAAVQARLFQCHGILTEDVPEDRLAPELADRRRSLSSAHRPGHVMLALTDALVQLRALDPESPVPEYWAGGSPPWQGKRNRSILAHGFKALGKDQWEEASNWFDERAQQLWRDLLPEGKALEQLPNRLPQA